MYRDDSPEQDPFFGKKAIHFQSKNQNQDLKSRLYRKGFKQTTMPSVKRPETNKNDNVMQARLIPAAKLQEHHL